MKPILFNTEMVRAILEGRKTVTRRPIKPQPAGELRRMGADSCYPGCFAAAGEDRVYQPPYMVGDVLYVRETWAELPVSPGGHFRPNGVYYYKAGPEEAPEGYLERWRPSIHMPREAARIFLRVTAVRAERLRDIFEDPPGPENQVVREGLKYGCDFIATWENTIKPKERFAYGYEANPWVWVIEFERIRKEDAAKKKRKICDGSPC